MRKALSVSIASLLAAAVLGLTVTGCGSAEHKEAPQSADTTVTEEAPQSADTTVTEEAPQSADITVTEEEQAIYMAFATTDTEGNEVTFDSLAEGASLILFNLWEPWCGPCVKEMPELERLYEEYQDRGFLIIGVYSTPDAEEDVLAVLGDAQITYPVIKMEQFLSMFQTGYVPTSFFVDGEGRLLSKEAIVGAHDYNSWKSMVEEYLE